MRLQSSIGFQIRMARQHSAVQFLRLVAVIAVIFMSASSHALQSQQTPAPGTRKAAPHRPAATGEKSAVKKTKDTEMAWIQDALQNKELMTDVGTFTQKLKDGIQYPAPRNRSNLLPRLPESTEFYVAIPNYGEPVHQALEIFRQELQESAAMREFLRKNHLDDSVPKIENWIQQFYEFSQFLGDEIIITGGFHGKEPVFLAVAEVKKPGAREFLEKLNNDVFTKPGDRLRILGPQELSADANGATQAQIVLVRKDLIAFGSSVASLREFTAQMDGNGPKFVAGALGQRVARSYQDGASSVIGIDLHRLKSLIPNSPPQVPMMLEKSGFGDAKYLVTENTIAEGRSHNHFEMAFNGPRHGVASWLAAPAPMGGLDFVSSKVALAEGMILKNPALILDDLREIVGDAAFASLPQMEAQLGVNLKQDLLSKLSGEIAFEIQQPPMKLAEAGQTEAKPAPAGPGAFKLILRVTDPAGLQQTLSRLLMMAPMKSGTREEDGVTFNTLKSPAASGQTNEINYFFMDGYLIIASDAATARDAVRVHRTGESLAKSGKLRDARPAGQPENSSLVMYQDASQAFGAMFAQMPPELRQILPITSLANVKPNVVYINGEESSFQGTTTDSINTDLAGGLIVAAIAIPNLIKSRTSANESAAASTLRTINTAEVTYSTMYQNKGYARSLAAMGPPTNGDCSGSNGTAAHACLLDGVLGNASCTAGKWCTKGGYRFIVSGICLQTGCKSYVATATPVSTSTGTKNFCTEADAVIRQHIGEPLQSPLTAAECRTWKPLGQE
jgi:type II secretory pathway pseudopilin PulG